MLLLFDHYAGFPTFSLLLSSAMVYRLKNLFFLIVLTCVLSACASPEAEPPREKTRAEKIVGDTGHFRGVSLGMSIDSVVVVDREYLFKRQLDELNYSIPFSHTDSSFFDVSYVFDQKGLFEIQVDVFLLSEKETGQLFDGFKSLLSSRYGEPSEKPNYAYWSTRNSGKDIEITLRDVSDEYDRPMISLNIIEPQRFIH